VPVDFILADERKCGFVEAVIQVVAVRTEVRPGRRGLV
jgi:hypothetical protein